MSRLKWIPCKIKVIGASHESSFQEAGSYETFSTGLYRHLFSSGFHRHHVCCNRAPVACSIHTNLVVETDEVLVFHHALTALFRDFIQQLILSLVTGQKKPLRLS
jgi:hypothetical protein